MAALAELVFTLIADTLAMLYGVFFSTRRRDIVRAYLLLLLFGFIGIHRINLAHYWTGCAMFVAFPILVLQLDWIHVFAWWGAIVAVDAFLLPGMVRRYNARVDFEDEQDALEKEAKTF